MHLREALDPIASIRQRLAASELFRGYRPLPVAFSGLLALGAGLAQSALLPEPMTEVRFYLLLWCGVALVGVLAAGLTMWLRDHVAGPSPTRAATWLAVRQFAPGAVGGAMATGVIVRFAPASAWLLPGLWQLFFSQSVFASCWLLPRPVFAVGVFYLAAGTLSLCVFREADALSPRAMVLPFGVGQLLSAAILYWTLERRDAVETET